MARVGGRVGSRTIRTIGVIALAGLTLSACSGDDSATDDEPAKTAASGKLNEDLAQEVVAHYAEGEPTSEHPRPMASIAADQRRWIARAIVSSAKSHVAFGLTLKEARHAERLLASTPARGEHDWER